jgi:hypothetical protein
MPRPSRFGARRLQWLLPIAAAAIALLGRARPAHGYPQWQLSTGVARCSQCHYSPGGGGLINAFGRDADGELSTFGGNGALLHGTVPLPAWLALGGDFRGGFVDHDVQDPAGNTVAVFPMQLDLAARVVLPLGFSISVVGGYRDQLRDPDLTLPYQNFHPVSASRLISREHYLMLQPEPLGAYLRAGRFYARYGLRMPEHLLYVNRDLGFDELEETYNVSGGYIAQHQELHLTGFAPDFWRHIGSNEKGFAGYFEMRFRDDTIAAAAQFRVAISPGVQKVMGGLVGKFYVAPLRTMFMGEADVVNQTFTELGDTNRVQAVAAAGFTIFPARGVLITALAERNQVDVRVNDAWTAGTLLVNWFPYAHVELQLMERIQQPSGGSIANTFFLQLHYFL